MIAAAPYQAGPPPTDVYVATLTVLDGEVVLGTPANISKSSGYDNQPMFTPDGRSILFTSVRGDNRPDPANAAVSGSDIYRYDIAGGRLTQVTSTPERVLADGDTRRGACIGGPRGTRRDSAPVAVQFGRQRCGTVATPCQAGGLSRVGRRKHPRVVRPRPAQHAPDRRHPIGKAEIVATDIGRSLGRMPGGGISYVQARGAKEGQVSKSCSSTRKPDRRRGLFACLPGRASRISPGLPTGCS